jgi:uncharacterized lipoprotein YmbA
MRARLIAFFVAAAACTRAVPETHHYRLELPVASMERTRIASPCAVAPASLMVDDLDVETAYEDVAIVYRESAYRLDRYHYHHWSAPPGQLVSDALRDGLSATGLFDRVGRAFDGDTDALVRGRVIAIEEVDRSKTRWIGRVELELELVDARTERRLWSQHFDASRELPRRSPEGLAAAVSDVLADIVQESAPAMATAMARSACEQRRRAEASRSPE